MPELPEIETIRKGLEETILGRPILAVEVRDARLVRPGKAALVRGLEGRKFTRVARRGKMLIFSLGQKKGECAKSYLLARLGMTGRLVYAAAKSEQEAPPSKHCHVLIRFSQARLAYCDARRFGHLELADEAGLAEKLARFGPEPLEKSFTLGVWRALLRGRRTAIKALLLDQARIAGIGNIYADEILFRAGVDPRRAAATLTDGETSKLYRAIRSILRQAIRARGTTVSDYVDATGRSGGFQNRLQVYGREGERCPGCAGKVQRIQVAGRSTHFCPRCQK